MITTNITMLKNFIVTASDPSLFFDDDGRVYLTHFNKNAQGKDPYTEIGKADYKYLSSETAGGFTGVYIDMFATGNGQRSASDADFDWFEYDHE